MRRCRFVPQKNGEKKIDIVPRTLPKAPLWSLASWCARTLVIVQFPVGVLFGTSCLADPPCCQFNTTSSALPPGRRTRTSKYVAFVRLLPENVTSNEPPAGIVAGAIVMLTTVGLKSGTVGRFGQGALMEVIQRLLLN